MDLSNNKIPINLNECFDILREVIKDSEDGDWFKKSSEYSHYKSIIMSHEN